MKIGIISAVSVLILAVIIVFSFEPPENLMKDDDIGMLGTKKDAINQRDKLQTDTPAKPEATTESPSKDGAE